MHTPEVRGARGARARVLGHGPPRSPRTPSAPGSPPLRVGSGRPPTPRAGLPSGSVLPPGVGRRPRGRGQHEKWVRRGRPRAQDLLWSPLSPPPSRDVRGPRAHLQKQNHLSLPGESRLQRFSLSFSLFFQGLGHTVLARNFDFSSPNEFESSAPWPLLRVHSDRAGSQSLQIPFWVGNLVSFC